MKTKTYGTRIVQTHGVVRNGAIVVCSLCGEGLANVGHGIAAHLRKHVRDGVLKVGDELDLRFQMIGKK